MQTDRRATMRPMPLDMPPEPSAYRVTLFYGPEPVEGQPDAVACVFNVKKRSWKAGIQVSVELANRQLAAIARRLTLSDRLSQTFQQSPPDAQAEYEARLPDLFAQAVSRCKLDLLLERGLPQKNQRLDSDDLAPQLDRAVWNRKEYVLAYILTELDVPQDHPSPSAG